MWLAIGQDHRLEFKPMPGDVMLIILLLILDCLNTEEDPAEHECQKQEEDQQFAHAKLRGMHRQGHGQAAENQHGCVDSAQLNVERGAAPDKGVIVRVTIDQISGKHATEEHDLGDEEYPHAEGRGFFLLLHVVEVVLQHGVVSFVPGRFVNYNAPIRQMPPPVPWSNGRLPRSQPAPLRNCEAAAEKWSATPEWWRPRDWGPLPRRSEASTRDRSWAAGIRRQESRPPQSRAHAAPATRADRRHNAAASPDNPG